MMRQRVDIVHLRSRMPAWIGYAAWRSIPASERPVLVTTFHGFYSVNAYSAIMAKGDGVIAISSSVKSHIEERYRRTDKVRLIFRGVDGEVFNPRHVERHRVDSLGNQWRLDRRLPVIMLPGRLTRLKGQEVFLRSLLHLNSVSYQAILVGDTSENPGYTAELNDFIRKNGLSSRVKLVGHCADMAAAYLLADIVLSTSSLEPEAFGRTTVEAMAMGRPVIATAHGGSLETVIPGVNGWLVRPSDPAELAKAVDEAIAMPPENREKMGKNGMDRVREVFTAKAMCEQTVQFYYDLLTAKGHIPAAATMERDTIAGRS